MPLTPAERQRRAKKHRAGDHSLCDPQRRCEMDPKLNPASDQVKPTNPPRGNGVRRTTRRAAAPTTRSSAPPPEPDPSPSGTDRPTKFGPRGQQLWDAMEGVEMGPAHRVLLVEACRLADRLDRFERTLAGGKWFFERVDEDERVEIVIDNVLSEARQYASALKAIVTELEPKPSVAAGAKPVPVKKAAGIADLSARLAARKAAGG